jgi:hypothetical protein
MRIILICKRVISVYRRSFSAGIVGVARIGSKPKRNEAQSQPSIFLNRTVLAEVKLSPKGLLQPRADGSRDVEIGR